MTRIRATIILVLFALLAPGAMAQNTIIDPEQPASILIYNRVVENPGDYTQPGTGEAAATPPGLPLPGVRFTITRVNDDAEKPEDAQPLEGAGAHTDSQLTDGDGLARFTNLPHGVYLVTQQQSAAVYEQIQPFLVSVPMTNAQGNAWMYTVYVYPKNQPASPPVIDMFVSSSNGKADTIGLGDTRTWYAVSSIPGDIGDAKQYSVKLTLNQNLRYVPDSLTVGTSGATVTLTEQDNDYSLDIGTTQITVTLEQSGFAKLAQAQAADDTELTISLDTTLTLTPEAQTQAMGARLSATAALQYTGSANLADSSSVEDDPYVYTGGLYLKKESRGGEPLSGAQFSLYPSLADATAGTSPVLSPEGDTAWTITTLADGVAYFYGLPYGGPNIASEGGDTTYYLVELQAPEGYNLLRSPMAVTVDSGSHLEQNATVVTNATGFLLPATGGIGTLIFLLCGGGLVGAGYLFLTRSRRRGHRDK